MKKNVERVRIASAYFFGSVFFPRSAILKNSFRLQSPSYQLQVLCCGAPFLLPSGLKILRRAHKNTHSLGLWAQRMDFWCGIFEHYLTPHISKNSF